MCLGDGIDGGSCPLARRYLQVECVRAGPIWYSRRKKCCVTWSWRQRCTALLCVAAPALQASLQRRLRSVAYSNRDDDVARYRWQGDTHMRLGGLLAPTARGSRSRTRLRSAEAPLRHRPRPPASVRPGLRRWKGSCPSRARRIRCDAVRHSLRPMSEGADALCPVLYVGFVLRGGAADARVPTGGAGAGAAVARQRMASCVPHEPSSVRAQGPSDEEVSRGDGLTSSVVSPISQPTPGLGSAVAGVVIDPSSD